MTLASVPEYDRDAVPAVGGHAVVIGGSMAGLLTARVLADGYDRVTILERDSIPERPVARRGVPQGHHAHIMLEAGRVILTDLFPGYQDDLVAAGAEAFDCAPDLQFFDHGGYLAESIDPLPMCSATRPLFEQVTRAHVTDSKSITLRAECQHTAYVTDDASTTVTGVEFTNKDGESETLAADLVVDATGRTSTTHRWLEQNGYSAPTTDTVTVDLGYSTVVIERPPDDTTSVLCAPSPPHTSGGAAVPVEGDRWLVTLSGMHGQYPPTDRDELLEFAENLPANDLAELLNTQTWLSSEIRPYRFPSNQWRHYENLSEFPDGLLVTGDAIASFNPVYGQGMSVAALDALQLHHALSQGAEGLAQRFFDRITAHIETVWRIAVGADFEFPETTGPEPSGTGLFNRYTARVIDVAQENREVATEFYHVLRLENEPTALLKPGILGRVLLPSIPNR